SDVLCCRSVGARVPDDAVWGEETEADVVWAACGEGLEQFDCTSVEVPSDYDEPNGRTTTIAMTRLPATDPEQKIGSLFLNFGGPGGPGVESVHMLGDTLFTAEVRAQFVII